MLTNKSNVWEFVEKYFPNYQQSSEIAESDDLQCIIDGEIEDGSHVLRLYNEIVAELSQNGDIPEPKEVRREAERRLFEVNAYIFEKSIENYLLTL